MPAPAEMVPRPRAPVAPLPIEASLRDRRSSAEQGARRLESPFAPSDMKKEQFEAAQKKGADAEAYAKTHENPRDTIKEQRGLTGRLSETELKHLGRVDSSLAGEVLQFDTYSSVMEESAKTGKTPEQICEDHKPPINGKQFETVRNEVLGRMVNMQYLQEAIPGFDKKDGPQRLIAVDAYAASHPGVRKLYVESMRDIARRAVAMPEDPTEAAKAGAKGKKDALDTDRGIVIDRIKARLGSKADTLSSDQIEQMFKGGLSVDEVEMNMVDDVLRANKINPVEYHARQEAQAARERMDVLRREFEGTHQNDKSKFYLKAYLKGHSPDPRVDEYRKLEGRTAEISKMEQIITPKQDQTIREIEESVYGKINYAKGGARVGGMRSDLEAIHDNLKQVRITEQAGKAPLTVDGEKTSADRTLLQEQLRDEMVGALETSIQDAFYEDYDRLDKMNTRKAEADALDAAEKGDVRRHDAILAIEKNQAHHGVETDPITGKKIVHCPDIGADVKRITEDTDNGVRRLELRSLTEGEHPVVALYETDERGVVKLGVDGKPIPKYFVDEKGLPYKDGVSITKVPATWESVRLEQLSLEDRTLLNEIHASQGESVAQKVMSDYFFGLRPPVRNVELHGTKKDLKLTDGQQADIAKYLGKGGIKEAYKDSRDYNTFKKILHERGINPNKGGPGWLLMLFLFLGGGVVRKKDET